MIADETSQSQKASLSSFQGPTSVAEQIALADAKVRRHVSYVIVGAFLLANVLTLAGVGYVVHEDNANLVAHLIAPASGSSHQTSS